MNFLLKHRRTALLSLADATAATSSCLCTYFLLKLMLDTNTGIPILLSSVSAFKQSLLLVVSTFLGMWLCGVYTNIWRYASIRDFSKCISGSLAGLIIFYTMTFIFELEHVDIFIAISAMLALLSISVLRISYSYLYNRIRTAKNGTEIPTMIVGGGSAANQLLLEMQGKESKYRPVVIVDDNNEKLGRAIKGVKIAGTINDIPHLANKYKIENILIAIPSCTPEQKKRILGICSETMCKVKTIPNLHELMSKSNILGQEKDIKIEDLLGRESVKLDDAQVCDLLSQKVCMVTGGGGSIGSELCRQIAKYAPGKLIIVDIYENNAYDIQQELLMEHPELDLDVRIASVRDYDKMKLLFEMFKPDIVYHAAAHKHVPLMETSPEEAIKNNIIGTYNVAALANFFDVGKMVLVSTDKAVNPTNVMGATKRCCEMIIQYFAQRSTHTEFVAVRFGNVLGSNGSVIPLFEKQIASGGPLTVTHPDIIRYFMTIPEAVSLILQAGTIAKGGEIFILDMGEPVKILDLAENLIKLHGMEPGKDIKIVFSGLRPGEKLFEELLMAEEGLRETANKKIFVGQQIEIDESSFISSIENIREIAQSNDSDKVVEELKKIVPTFNHTKIAYAKKDC